MRYFAVVLVTALTALITTGPGHAASVRSTATEAELVARQAAIAPGASLELGLRLKLDPQWHVYWKNAGDSGTPPSLTLELPAGLSAGPMQFGYPSRIPVAHLVNYGYEGEVLFPVHVDVPARFTSPGAVMIRARADWLECKESCLPASADLELALPVAPSGAPGPWSSLFDATRAKLPVALPAGMTTAATAGADALALNIDGLTDCVNADFFPDREGFFAHAKIARVAVTALPRLGFSLPLEGNAKAPDRLTGVLTCSAAGGPIRAYEVAAAVEAIPMNTSAVDAASLSFGLALLFAFAGGLLLNLMPCVFPVLGLKILGLAQLPQAAARIGHAARFLAGVLVSFGVLAGAMLALRAAGAQIGWGFQLQSPAFVAAIAVLFFLLALNLSRFFEWGGGIQSAAGGAGARWSGPFADGVLAAVIASPCTAPLMGAAIGFTLTQPAPILFGVFIAIALGMALPYVLLSLYPGWVRLMPKPGVRKVWCRVPACRAKPAWLRHPADLPPPPARPRRPPACRMWT